MSRGGHLDEIAHNQTRFISIPDGIVNLKNFVDELSPLRRHMCQIASENMVRKRVSSPLWRLFLMFNLYNFA
jgi:hypothetical protein